MIDQRDSTLRAVSDLRDSTLRGLNDVRDSVQTIETHVREDRQSLRRQLAAAQRRVEVGEGGVFEVFTPA